jgi:cytochrome c peroxidase
MNVYMRRLFFVLACCFVVAWSTGRTLRSAIGAAPMIEYYKTESGRFANATARLQTAITRLGSNDPRSIAAAREALRECRACYKRIEFFLEYFFRSAAMIYNGPPKYEIEEPYMEYQAPVGLQVIEALLFGSDVNAVKAQLLQEVAVINSSAADLSSLLYGFTADDAQIMESVRLELVRVYTLSISGFDAPLLKSGIGESYEALSGIRSILRPFLQKRTPHADSVAFYLSGSLQYLRSDSAFDTFDRLRFLTRFALPLQRNLGALIREMQLEQQTVIGALNYDAEHIFSQDAISIQAFSNTAGASDTALIALGKRLFYETALSGNNKISCATCHRPEHHFSDLLPKSIGFDGHSPVQRNTPSLLYAGFQYAQFWDGRDSTLEMQVKDVMSNPLEMNADHRVVIQQLSAKALYRQLFEKAFPGSRDSLITTDRVAASIAAFVRGLNPRNAAFDRYIAGDQTAMSSAQQRGFNLFMGKAQCGTCHFAPLFNGLVPPLYNLTELEVLGTTATDDLNRPQADNDSGRYTVFPIEYYEGAFKTPTVRNVSATGPYMHNGAFSTLEGVVEFYNKGGGRGLGLDIKQQTLASAPLDLSTTEVNDIVSFLHALEDKVAY